MARLYMIGGEVKNVFPANKEKGFTLKECYDLIGCELVELVRGKGYDYIVDEEGLLKQDPIINIIPSLECGTQLVGNVLRCEPGEFQ